MSVTITIIYSTSNYDYEYIITTAHYTLVSAYYYITKSRGGYPAEEVNRQRTSHHQCLLKVKLSLTAVSIHLCSELCSHLSSVAISCIFTTRLSVSHSSVIRSAFVSARKKTRASLAFTRSSSPRRMGRASTVLPSRSTRKCQVGRFTQRCRRFRRCTWPNAVTPSLELCIPTSVPSTDAARSWGIVSTSRPSVRSTTWDATRSTSPSVYASSRRFS